MKRAFILIVFILSIFFFSNFTYSKFEPPVEKFINEWSGVPYKFGGKTKKGIDCSKLTQKFYKEVYNIDIPEVCWKQWNHTQRIPKDSLKTGDLVFFNSKRSPDRKSTRLNSSH